MTDYDEIPLLIHEWRALVLREFSDGGCWDSSSTTIEDRAEDRVDFYSITPIVIAWIHHEYPNLDVSPIQRICDGIRQWEQESMRNLPRKKPRPLDLNADFDKAMSLLSIAAQKFLLTDGKPEAGKAATKGFGEATLVDKASMSKRTRRKHRQRNTNALTAKQLEAVEAFAECETNYVRTAKKMGLSRAAAKDRVVGAYKKLGTQVPKISAKSKTRTLPTDHRGGVAVAKDRRQG